MGAAARNPVSTSRKHAAKQLGLYGPAGSRMPLAVQDRKGNPMDSGSLAWVLTSAALVLFMTPGLAFFYGGMDRSRNVLNMLMMNFYCLLIVPILWVVRRVLAGVRARSTTTSSATSTRFMLKDITVAGDGGQLAIVAFLGHVRGDHAGADLRRRRRPHEVLGVGAVRAAVAVPRLRPDLQVGVRRLARPARLARLRRRHGHPRQRRHRRARRRARARQAQGLAAARPNRRTPCRS